MSSAGTLVPRQAPQAGDGKTVYHRMALPLSAGVPSLCV